MPYTFYMLCFLYFRVHQRFDFIFLLDSTASTPPEALPNHRRTQGLLMGIYQTGYAQGSYSLEEFWPIRLAQKEARRLEAQKRSCSPTRLGLRM